MLVVTNKVKNLLFCIVQRPIIGRLQRIHGTPEVSGPFVGFRLLGLSFGLQRPRLLVFEPGSRAEVYKILVTVLSFKGVELGDFLLEYKLATIEEG